MMAKNGRVALVTGGAQGIGRAIAARFLTDGWSVVIADCDVVAGRETADELAPHGALHFVATDVADEPAVRAVVAAAVTVCGGLDLLVNNAGFFRAGPPETLDLADWNRVVAVNLTGAFLCAKHAAPHLRARRGCIINIASTRALMSEPNSEAYAATKAGLVGLTHALALSLAPDVRVNCISPGWIETAAWQRRERRHEPTLSAADHGQHPCGRVGRPEDIAALAAFLANDAGFITGQNIVADGGMTRKMIYV